MDVQGRLEMWRSDPIAFVRDVLRNPETNQPFVLYEAQERFLREALRVGPDGRLVSFYDELISPDALAKDLKAKI